MHSRRIAGAHLAINLEQSVDWFSDRVLLECLCDDNSDIVAFREKDREVLDSGLNNFLKLRRGDLIIRFDDNFAGFSVDHIGSGISTFELGRIHLDFADVCLTQTFQRSPRDLFSLANDWIRAATLDLKIDFHPDQVGLAGFGHLDHQTSVFDSDFIDYIKVANNVFVGEG